MYEPANLFLTPQQIETKKLRRCANFSGSMILTMMAVNTVGSVVVVLLGLLGVFDFQADYYGLSNTGFLILNMVLYLLFLPVAALAVALIGRSKIQPFPSRKVGLRNLICLFFIGMGLSVLSNLLSNYLMSILVGLGVPYPTFPEMLELTSTSLILNIISSAVLPALLEEMIFRGYIQGALSPFGNGIAVVLSAFLFGIFHGNILQFPFAFFMGLVFGWMVVQTGSIWPSVLMHFGNNLMSTLLDWFSKAYPDYQNAQIIITFAAFAAAGMVAMGVLLVRDNGGSSKPDLLRPLHNGASLLSVPQRVKTALFSPAMLIALILLVIQLVSSMVAT